MKIKFTNFRSVLAVLGVFLGALSLNAQIIYQEDFEGGSLPAGMVTVDKDGDGLNFEYSGTLGRNGSGGLRSLSWISQTGTPLTPDNYIFLPKIDFSVLPSTKTASLIFYVASLDNDPYLDGYSLWVSTNSDSANIDSLVVLKPFKIAQNGYVRVEVDMTPYVAKQDTCVFIAFRHNLSDDKNALLIDDILISTPITDDIVFVDAKVGEYAVIPQFLSVQEMPYMVTIGNEGLNKATGVTLNHDFGTWDGVSYTSSSTGSIAENTSIQSGEMVTINGTVNTGFPVVDDQYAISFASDMDKTDFIPANNNSLIFLGHSVSEKVYSRVSPFIGAQRFRFSDIDFLAMDTNPFEGHPDPSGEPVDTVYWGNVYEFYNDSKTDVDSVVIGVAPEGTGQTVWVNVYNYENATNQIGEPVEVIATSDPFVIPAGWDDNFIHDIQFTFNGGPLGLEAGKYIFAIGESGNAAATAAGIIGLDATSLGTILPRDIDDNVNTRGVSMMNFETESGELGWLPSSSVFAGAFAWDISLIISNSTGTAENVDYSSTVELFPNPSNGMVNVSIRSNEFRPDHIQIMDLAGRTLRVVNNVNKAKVISLDLSEFEAGVYFVQLNDGEQSARKKVILK